MTGEDTVYDIDLELERFGGDFSVLGGESLSDEKQATQQAIPNPTGEARKQKASKRANRGEPDLTPKQLKHCIDQPTLYHTILELDKITNENLERKLIDILRAKTQIPRALEDDAAQEIRMVWSLSKARGGNSYNQIAAYAYYMGYHACLRLRRELGSAVRLPGSAFRKKKDGSTYVKPGHLAPALAWDEVAEFMDEGVFEDDRDYALGHNPQAVHETKDILEHFRRRQLEGELNKRQIQILKFLSEGLSVADISDRLGVQESTLLRNVRAILKLLEQDAGSKS